MEIRVLHYFLTVITEGSISQAANSLHITQPTISRQLKELEEELGKQLFIRHKKGGISLTPEGLLLQSRAQEIMTMVEQTEKEFMDLTDLVQGDIYIGGGETKTFGQIAKLAKELQGGGFSRSSLPPLFSRFRRNPSPFGKRFIRLCPTNVSPI